MKIKVNLDYKNERKKAYPPIEEQLDILFHEGYEGWKQRVEEVKNKYPK
jgi:hypothetical protein